MKLFERKYSNLLSIDQNRCLQKLTCILAKNQTSFEDPVIANIVRDFETMKNIRTNSPAYPFLAAYQTGLSKQRCDKVRRLHIYIYICTWIYRTNLVNHNHHRLTKNRSFNLFTRIYVYSFSRQVYPECPIGFVADERPLDDDDEEIVGVIDEQPPQQQTAPKDDQDFLL